MTPSLKKSEALRGALLEWWHSLESNRGARAELRRCDTLLDVMLSPAFHAARRRMIEAGLNDTHEPIRSRLAAVIGLAAHLRISGSRAPAESFSSGDRPPVSPLRFRQILSATNDEELFRRIRRVLPLAEGMSLILLSSDVLDWDERIRKQWVYAYRWPSKTTA